MPKYKTKIVIIVLLHTKVANSQPLEFLATMDTTSSSFESAKLYLPVSIVKKPNLKLSDATKAVLQRAAVPFTDFTYEGVIAARNFYEQETHHFDFVVACEYKGTGFITRSSMATGVGANTIHCMFFPFEKILESVQHANDPLQYVLSKWMNTKPKEMLPAFRPHEDYNWEGRALDLKAFVIISNRNPANSTTATTNTLTQSDQILLIENERGHLYLPGAKFGQTENLHNCSVRVAELQTGYKVNVSAISEIVYGWADYSPLHFYVVATIEGGTMKTAADEHSRGVRWVSLEELLVQVNNRGGGAEYQKMWELKTQLTNYAQNYKTNNFVALYGQ